MTYSKIQGMNMADLQALANAGIRDSTYMSRFSDQVSGNISYVL
jgi:hypothetical protein